MMRFVILVGVSRIVLELYLGMRVIQQMCVPQFVGIKLWLEVRNVMMEMQFLGMGAQAVARLRMDLLVHT